MAAGVTQPGGAGTKICIYDDASSASGTGYTMAEISAAFPAVIIDNGTNRKSYRCTQDIQIGDTGVGTATTTLQDTNVDIFFDSGKILRTRATQTTSWYLRLGTKVGSGNKASGKDGCMVVMGAALANWPLQTFLYGCTIRQTSGAMVMTSTSGISENINCLFQSSASGTTPFGFGNFTTYYGNLYNVDISHVTTAQVMSNFNSTTAERISVAAAAPTTFLSSGSPSVAVKDLAMFGTPTQSDLRWANNASLDWKLIRPIWTGAAPKFSITAGNNIAVANAAVEYWLYDVKCVNAAGSGVSGIPVKITDTIGNVQVDTTTDANGAISFGSGLTANAMAVLDHYTVASVYTQRHRSPFLVEINLPSMTGYNNAYESLTYSFKWPGSETYTTNSGTLEDVTDVVSLGPFTPDPFLVDDLPLEASGEVRIMMPTPEVA